MFCTQCGARNPDDAHFCGKCGNAIPQHDDVSEAAGTQTTDPSSVTISPADRRPTTQSKPSTRRHNIIAKHWAGGYSLAFAYWVIGFVGTFLATIAIEAADIGASSLPPGEKISAALILLFYASVIAFTLWQLVGIWRSADYHVSRGGTRFWAGLAKFAVILGLLHAVSTITTMGVPIITELSKLLVSGDDTPPYHLSLLRDGTELELSGGIPFGTTDAVKKVLDAAPAVRVIQLNSVGGRIAEANALFQLIKKRNLYTYTSISCVSACALAFLAGQEKYLGEAGRLGFHSASVGGEGGAVIEGINDDIRAQLQAQGIPESFINRALSTAPHDMWYPTQKELLRAKVIDAVVDSRYFGLPSVLQWRDAYALEQSILKIPLFSALARYDPANYAKILKILVSGIEGGRALIDIQQDARAVFVSELLPNYLKVAPDKVLLTYMQTQVEEMVFLAKRNVQKCADFTFPEYAKAPLDIARELPANLIQDDLSALAAIVEGAATAPQKDSFGRAQEVDLDAALKSASKVYPKSTAVLANPAAYAHKPAALCYSTVALYSEVLAMPNAHRAATLLRYLFTEG